MDIMGTLMRATSAATSLLGGAGGLDGVMARKPDFMGGTDKTAKVDDSFGFDDVLAVFDAGMSRGQGAAVNTLLDRLGLPDVVGDVVGTVVDLATLNYPGAVANGLDAAVDIAQAAGHEKLAGYLDVGRSLAETGVELGRTVALALATGGGSAAVSVGGMTTSVSSILQTVSMVRGGLEAGAAVERGDYLGAAFAGFGALANFGGLGDMLGMSPDTLSKVADVAKYGAQATGVLQGVMEDGEVTLSDLKHVPVLQLLGAAGVPTQGKEDLIGGLVGFLSGGADGAAAAPLLGQLAQSLIGAVSGDQPPAAGLSFLTDLLTTSAQSPQLLELLGAVLQGAASRTQDVDLVGQHAGHMRI